MRRVTGASTRAVALVGLTWLMLGLAACRAAQTIEASPGQQVAQAPGRGAAPELTCQALRQRLGGDSTRASFEGQSVVAVFEGSAGVAIASATVEHTFRVIEVLDEAGPLVAEVVRAWTLRPHPDSPLNPRGLTVSERTAPVRGHRYVLYVQPDRPVQQVPLRATEDARELDALLRSGRCEL